MDEQYLSIIDPSSIDTVIRNGDYFSENADSFKSTRLKSEQNAATYEKLIDLISKLIDLTNESRERPIKVVSYSSYKKTDDIQVPVIVYRTQHRAPQKETKPRYRETVNDPNNINKTIAVYGQRFDYVLEFIIVDSSDELAENTMSEFEDLIFSYTGYLISQGVSNIRFLEQSADDAINLKEDFFIKTLLYGVTLEKITLVSEDKIQTIISRI